MTTYTQGGVFRSFKADGTPNASGFVYTYAAGTLTPLATYVTPGGSANANPVALGVDGAATICLADWVNYRFIEKTAIGTTIKDTDNIVSNGALADLASTASGKGAALVGWLRAATSAIAATVQNRLSWLPLNPFEFMTIAQIADAQSSTTPTLDSSAAFAAAWAAVKTRGGKMEIPAGVYLHNSAWLIDIDLTLPHNYEITGYGATIFNGVAVAGFAVVVSGSYNNFGATIRGLQFNHRNNTTVGGCIQAIGSANLKIEKCAAEMHNTKAGYAALEIGPTVPGNGNTNSFWTLIDGFSTRQRSGGDGTVAAMGIRLRGVANATKIINCQLGSVIDAIRFDTDGVSGGLANAVNILHNDFEGCTNAITFNTAAPCTAMPTGVHIAFNRVESVTGAFLNVTGAAVVDSSYPPVVRDNYCTVGSVTNYLVNPNNQYFFTSESSYFGVGPRNYIGGPSDYTIITEGSGRNLVISNLSGVSTYDSGHLKFGVYHMWVDGATSLPFMKSNGVAPTSSQDGSMCGVLRGSATFAAATSVVVTTGYTMASANYSVNIDANTNRTFWVTGKTTTQFTINAAAANSDTVGWVLSK